MAVNHFSLPNVFSALNRKARGTHRDWTMALRAEQQHDMNSAGHTVTDDRKKRKKKSEELVIVVWASAVWMIDTPKNITDDLVPNSKA